MEEAGADKLEKGRESRDKEKLHTNRAESLWQVTWQLLLLSPRWIQLLQKQEIRGEELWWGQGAQKGLGNWTWMLSSCFVMPALPSRGMCWKLAALIYQSQLRTSPGVQGWKHPSFPPRKAVSSTQWDEVWALSTALDLIIETLSPWEKEHRWSPLPQSSPSNHKDGKITVKQSSCSNNEFFGCFSLGKVFSFSLEKTVIWELKLSMVLLLVK